MVRIATGQLVRVWSRLLSDVARLEWRVPHDICAGPKAAKLEKHRGVYWLPCSATEHTDGAPLCPNPRTARLAVEAPPISVPDPDATPMQLEESEETRRPKHGALPANVSKEEFDAHQLSPMSVVVRSLRERQTSGGRAQTKD